MTAYETAVVNKKFLPNVVILFKGIYWGIRQPDSGLTIGANYLGVEQVSINPTKVDPYKANTTINTYSFRLVDKNGAVSALFYGITKFFQNEPVRIFIGRQGLAFGDYLELPQTTVKSVSKLGNSYSFSTTEAKDRLNRPAFNQATKLEVDIMDDTTEIDALESLEGYPSSGLIKIDSEFISYASLDLVNNRFSGCVRGEENSVPAAHAEGADIFVVTVVEENPIDILLQCLISNGGTGPYDVLIDGAGIDASLIDVAKFEAIRTEFFSGQTYRLLFFGLTNILSFLEEQILYPNELRIISNNSAKISLAILNRRVFDDSLPVIDNTSIVKEPGYFVDDTKIINSVTVEFDYSEATQKYLKKVTLEDSDSITDFGKRDPKVIKLKGVKASMDGEDLATNIAQRFLSRFSYPRPEISINTHLDKHLILLGEKAELVTPSLPNGDGELNFGETLEVIEKGINWETSDVKIRLAFTSFTGVRECYLAPSDAMTFVTAAQFTIGAGRGLLYTPGWKMRLYSNIERDYFSSQINEIASIVDDTINFVDEWEDTAEVRLMTEDDELLTQEDEDYLLVVRQVAANEIRMMFADYDDCVLSQQRYCFISAGNTNFSDGKKPYQITF